MQMQVSNLRPGISLELPEMRMRKESVRVSDFLPASKGVGHE